MSEENDSSNEYAAPESTEISTPETTDIIEEEPKIDEMIYGKNKPRRVTIDRKITHDEENM
jgi:hypothetical protein